MTEKQVKGFRYWFPLLAYFAIMVSCFVAQVSWALPPVAATAQQLGAVDWEAEGTVIHEGTVMFFSIGVRSVDGMRVVYIDNDGFQQIAWIDGRIIPDKPKYYYPYGPLKVDERFRMIRLTDGKHRLENLDAKDRLQQQTTEVTPTEDEPFIPDRRKQ